MISKSKYDEALDKLKQGLDLCQKFPSKVKWHATLLLSVGNTLFKQGNVRDGIAELLGGLKVLRSVKYPDHRLEEQFLGSLIVCYEDIGKLVDAQNCRNDLERLN